MTASASDYYVIRFNQSKNPGPEIFEEKKDELEKQMTAEKSNALLAAWVAHLEKNAKITVNDKQL